MQKHHEHPVTPRWKICPSWPSSARPKDARGKRVAPPLRARRRWPHWSSSAWPSRTPAPSWRSEIGQIVGRFRRPPQLLSVLQRKARATTSRSSAPNVVERACVRVEGERLTGQTSAEAGFVPLVQRGGRRGPHAPWRSRRGREPKLRRVERALIAIALEDARGNRAAAARAAGMSRSAFGRACTRLQEKQRSGALIPPAAFGCPHSAARPTEPAAGGARAPPPKNLKLR